MDKNSLRLEVSEKFLENSHHFPKHHRWVSVSKPGCQKKLNKANELTAPQTPGMCSSKRFHTAIANDDRDLG